MCSCSISHEPGKGLVFDEIKPPIAVGPRQSSFRRNLHAAEKLEIAVENIQLITQLFLIVHKINQLNFFLAERYLLRLRVGYTDHIIPVHSGNIFDPVEVGVKATHILGVNILGSDFFMILLFFRLLSSSTISYAEGDV